LFLALLFWLSQFFQRSFTPFGECKGKNFLLFTNKKFIFFKKRSRFFYSLQRDGKFKYFLPFTKPKSDNFLNKRQGFENQGRFTP